MLKLVWLENISNPEIMITLQLCQTCIFNKYIISKIFFSQKRIVLAKRISSMSQQTLSLDLNNK